MQPFLDVQQQLGNWVILHAVAAGGKLVDVTDNKKEPKKTPEELDR